MNIGALGQYNASAVLDTARSAASANESEFESALQKAFSEGDKEELKAVCTELESVMLSMLYKQMKATIPTGGFIETSTARSIFQDMLDEELMKKGSERGIGVGDMLYKQLSAQMDRTYKVGEKVEE